VAILIAYAALATTLIYIGISESNESFASEDSFSRGQWLTWCVLAGIAGLAFGITCLRSRLYKTLSLVIAGGFFIYVTGFSFLIEQKQGGEGSGLAPIPFAPWHAVVLLLIAGAVAWCQRQTAEKASANNHAKPRFRATAYTSAILILFAAWVAVFGLGHSKPHQAATQPTTPAKPRPTDDEIRRVVAKDLNVPIERVVPSARLVEDLNASNQDIEKIVEDFEQTFAVDRQPPDDEMLITVQDAFDYVYDPETFRTQHEDHFRGQH